MMSYSQVVQRPPRPQTQSNRKGGKDKGKGKGTKGNQNVDKGKGRGGKPHPPLSQPTRPRPIVPPPAKPTETATEHKVAAVANAAKLDGVEDTASKLTVEEEIEALNAKIRTYDAVVRSLAPQIALGEPESVLLKERTLVKVQRL